MTPTTLDAPLREGASAEAAPPGPEAWFWAGWEPRSHYQRRGGSRGTFYFGGGPWVEEWEQRLFSDDTIDLAAGMGATILVTRFYKGMGRRVESPAWPALRDFARRCHQRGLKVWGYCQGSSIYPEFMLSERPDLHEWVAKDYEGKPQSWSASYYRLAPCLTSEAYRDYLLSIVREGVGWVGLDGLHVDNSYYRHCWCERCQSRFRDYLAQRGDLEQTTGIPEARHLKAPPLPGSADLIQDPLRIHWMEFGVQVRHEFYRQLRAALKQENPQASVSANSAFPRADLACELRQALNPAREGELFDFCCAENGAQPRFEKGAVIGQTEAYLFAEAGGYRVWSTAWRSGAFGNSPPPGPAAIWAVAAEEFSHGTALLGNNWALRPAGEGGRFLCEAIPAQSAAFAEAARFFREVAAREALEGRRSWAEVGILVDAHSFSIAGLADPPALRQLMQYFFRAKIPFQFVFPGKPVPSSVRTLVAWASSCLSRETLEALAHFALEPGRRVVVSEASGVFDSWHVPHDFGFLREWRQRPGVSVIRADVGRAALPKSGAHLHDAVDGLDEASRSALDAFFLGEAFRPQMRFELPETALVHLERSPEAGRLVHLREQAGSGQPVCGAKIWMAGKVEGAVRFHTPGGLGGELAATPAARGGWEVHLPEFMHYGLLVLPEEPPAVTP